MPGKRVRLGHRDCDKRDNVSDVDRGGGYVELFCRWHFQTKVSGKKPVCCGRDAWDSRNRTRAPIPERQWHSSSMFIKQSEKLQCVHPLPKRAIRTLPSGPPTYSINLRGSWLIDNPSFFPNGWSRGKSKRSYFETSPEPTTPTALSFREKLKGLLQVKSQLLS